MTQNQNEVGGLLRIRDVAGVLGVSERQAWKLVREGLITPLRLGRRSTRFRAAEVDRFIESLEPRESTPDSTLRSPAGATGALSEGKSAVGVQASGATEATNDH